MPSRARLPVGVADVEHLLFTEAIRSSSSYGVPNTTSMIPVQCQDRVALLRAATHPSDTGHYAKVANAAGGTCGAFEIADHRHSDGSGYGVSDDDILV